MSFPVVIGENGLGWGRGIHSDNFRSADMPFKREGDGRSPSGAFRLLSAYGYERPDLLGLKFPYRQSSRDYICCDDTRSPYYNRVINVAEEYLDRRNLPSHEKMYRDDICYKYAIYVAHNAHKPVPGAGSCIFIHVWLGEDVPTSGCTAMSEGNMLALLRWLDPAKNPVLVQLTEKDYIRLKMDWNLP